MQPFKRKDFKLGHYRHTGIHRNTIMRIKGDKRFRVQREDGICRAIAQAKRVELYNQTIPEGMRLGWTCAVAYCGNPEHFTLAENKNHGKADYREIRRQLGELKDDEWFDLPYLKLDEKGRTKFRAGLGSASPHFLMRSLPTGGLRIIRTGYWGDDKAQWYAKLPQLVRKWAKPANTIKGVFLGQFWGCWDEPKSTRLPRVMSCSEKACPFPRMSGATVCRQHWQWDSALVSYPREPRIDKYEVQSRASDDRSVGSGNLDSLFHSGWLGEDKYGFMYTTTKVNRGGFVQRSQAERDNDKWWKENVIDQGIEAPGVMVRKTAKELKAEMDAMIDNSLASYSAMQSEMNLKAFWRVRKEKNPIRPIYADELLKQEPDLRPGVNVQDSLRGKMRRHDSGHGIRKKQRKRAPGWTSHRHQHDPQYFTRETVRAMDYNEWEARDGETED